MSTRAPASNDMGAITVWAAVALAAVRGVPWPGTSNDSFCPTRGSMAASVKWNIARRTAKTGSGRFPSNAPQSEGFWPGASGFELCTSPRATSWSMARAGIASTEMMLPTAIAPKSQNTTPGPKKAALTPATTLKRRCRRG